MAVGLLRKALAERGLDGVEVQSAGVAALEGQPPEPLAQDVLRPFGVDISEHRAQALTEELIQWADCILVMGPEHKAAVEALDPEASEKVRLLGAYGPGGRQNPEQSIPDPYGGGSYHYRTCAVVLMEALQGFLQTEADWLAGDRKSP